MVTSLPYKSKQHLPIGLAALYAGRDLPWGTRLKIKMHLRRCAECEGKVESFRAATAELRREAEANTLTGFEAIADWARLEREMMGNIAVGVAAARCVDKVRGRGILWLRGALIAGLGTLFVAGWITHIPREETEHLLASLRSWAGHETAANTGTVLRSFPDSVAVRTGGASLKLMHPRSAVTSIAGGSAVQASYIDEETGQVTITGVYGQQ
jgi:hypothetical protein